MGHFFISLKTDLEERRPAGPGAKRGGVALPGRADASVPAIPDAANFTGLVLGWIECLAYKSIEDEWKKTPGRQVEQSFLKR